MQLVDTSLRRSNVTKRLVIVAENSLIVEAIRIGFRRSGEFHLVGHAPGRTTSAHTIVGATPDVVLLDDMDHSARALELVREINAYGGRIAIVVLSVQLDPSWLERLFDAGATCAISKETHPAALASLVRETLNGHIYVGFANPRSDLAEPVRSASTDDPPLTSRELEILQLVAAGSTNGEVARRLWITEQTVKFHLRNIYRKLDVANRTQASHYAHTRGLVKVRTAGHSETEPGPRAQLTVA
jgi:DNA-binding NarL/FixJ family response regulator